MSLQSPNSSGLILMTKLHVQGRAKDETSNIIYVRGIFKGELDRGIRASENVQLDPTTSILKIGHWFMGKGKYPEWPAFSLSTKKKQYNLSAIVNRDRREREQKWDESRDTNNYEVKEKEAQAQGRGRGRGRGRERGRGRGHDGTGLGTETETKRNRNESANKSNT